MCYDLTSLASFDNIQEWVTQVKKVFPKKEGHPYLALVGNKKDLLHMREVKIDSHLKFCEDHNAIGSLVSARTGDGVQKVFYMIAATLLGIRLDRVMLDNQIAVVKAEIVNHDKDDPLE